MEHEYIVTTVRLLLAALAGGLIGLERSHHGRPAGFRTHTLVCLSAALLMVLGVFQWDLVLHAPLETIRVDPTRILLQKPDFTGFRLGNKPEYRYLQRVIQIKEILK